MNTPSSSEALRVALVEHLDRWGLRRFDSDDAYFAYQRTALAPAALAELTARAQRKHDRPGDPGAELGFYDLAARHDILPVLYSQRYDYFLVVGAEVAARIGAARRALDFGCGIGVLTAFYAEQYPECRFIGVDRSPASVAVAAEHAARLRLGNLRFVCEDPVQILSSERVDLILCTHALLQAEQDPGLPSASWATDERAVDASAQADFERRTGLDLRLDRLVGALSPGGRVLVFEKTRQLARRVPMQRALAARRLRLLEPPVPLRYHVVEEVTDDGPLFHAARDGERRTAGGASVEWDEAPERQPGEERYLARGEAAMVIRSRLPVASIERTESWDAVGVGRVRAEIGTSAPGLEFLFLAAESGFHGMIVRPRGGRPLASILDDLESLRRIASPGGLERQWGPKDAPVPPDQTPLYENHHPTAQAVWRGLPDRSLKAAQTFREPTGREVHVELGVSAGVTYLYWANTFDERQLVLLDAARQEVLEAYYVELVSAARAGGAVPLEA